MDSIADTLIVREVFDDFEVITQTKVLNDQQIHERQDIMISVETGH